MARTVKPGGGIMTAAAVGTGKLVSFVASVDKIPRKFEQMCLVLGSKFGFRSGQDLSTGQ